jgi:phage-Barnase-EndoU-ColicinE5/D-RelE like nuclease3
MSSQVQSLYRQTIKGSEKDSLVENKIVLICKLSNLIRKEIDCIDEPRVYMTSRALKHIYDRKPAEEFHFLVKNIEKIIKFPDQIFLNKPGKRGEFCFVKKIGNDKYICPLEKIQDNISINNPSGIYVATGYRIRKENYLKNYKLVWSWKGDKPSS